MRCLVSIAFLVVACSKSNDVTLLLGPDETTFSQGFRCLEAATDNFLVARAVVGNELRFQIVVDVIDLGGKFPGCRGEELLQACGTDGCPLAVSANPRGRYCQPLAIPLTNDQRVIEDSIRAALRSKPEVLRNAPDRPVMIRVVATTQPCAEIQQPAGDVYVNLRGDAAVGCAYSCPVQLDQVQGSISVSLDALSEYCESEVRVCAKFPGR